MLGVGVGEVHSRDFHRLDYNCRLYMSLMARSWYTYAYTVCTDALSTSQSEAGRKNRLATFYVLRISATIIQAQRESYRNGYIWPFGIQQLLAWQLPYISRPEDDLPIAYGANRLPVLMLSIPRNQGHINIAVVFHRHHRYSSQPSHWELGNRQHFHKQS